MIHFLKYRRPKEWLFPVILLQEWVRRLTAPELHKLPGVTSQWPRSPWDKGESGNLESHGHLRAGGLASIWNGVKKSAWAVGDLLSKRGPPFCACSSHCRLWTEDTHVNLQPRPALSNRLRHPPANLTAPQCPKASSNASELHLSPETLSSSVVPSPCSWKYPLLTAKTPGDGLETPHPPFHPHSIYRQVPEAPPPNYTTNPPPPLPARPCAQVVPLSPWTTAGSTHPCFASSSVPCGQSDLPETQIWPHHAPKTPK